MRYACCGVHKLRRERRRREGLSIFIFFLFFFFKDEELEKEGECYFGKRHVQFEVKDVYIC